MKLRFTALFRPDAIHHDFTKPPSRENPGGGLAKKAQQLRLGLPFVELTSDITALGEIVLVEPLWFTSHYEGDIPFSEALLQRARTYAAHRGFKMLWTSDFDCFRWPGEVRDIIFDATDVLCGNTPYMVDVLKAFRKNVALLTDPFDMDAIKPASLKEPRIYSCSQVIAEKRVFTVTAVYNGLPHDLGLDKGFIGSSHVWGIEDHNEPHTAKLEQELSDACDWEIKSAPAHDVAANASRNWGYICDAGMETFGYGLAEAMAGGAVCFCGQHLSYADRPVYYFSSVEDAVLQVTDVFRASDLKPLDAPRQWLSEHCSLDVFRSQFWQIVGGAYGVN